LPEQHFISTNEKQQQTSVQAEISLTIPIGDVLPDSSDPITATEISLESDDKPNSQFSSFELTLPLLGAALTLTVQIPLNAKLMDDKLMNSLYALKAFILATKCGQGYAFSIGLLPLQVAQSTSMGASSLKLQKSFYSLIALSSAVVTLHSYQKHQALCHMDIIHMDCNLHISSAYLIHSQPFSPKRSILSYCRWHLLSS